MGNIIQGIDILDVVNFVSKRNKRGQAILLEKIEQIIDKESEEYKQIRKVVLDWSNDYTRAILKIIFGTDFEGTMR